MYWLIGSIAMMATIYPILMLMYTLGTKLKSNNNLSIFLVILYPFITALAQLIMLSTNNNSDDILNERHDRIQLYVNLITFLFIGSLCCLAAFKPKLIIFDATCVSKIWISMSLLVCLLMKLIRLSRPDLNNINTNLTELAILIPTLIFSLYYMILVVLRNGSYAIWKTHLPIGYIFIFFCNTHLTFEINRCVSILMNPDAYMSRIHKSMININEPTYNY